LISRDETNRSNEQSRLLTDRYAAVAEQFVDDRRVGALIGLCETEEEGFETS